MRFEELAEVGLQQLIGHSEPVSRIEHLLRQEEAVLTIQVADRAGRLGENVISGRECHVCEYVSWFGTLRST